MPSEFSIAQIIKFSGISQYLAANDKSAQKQLQSGSFIGILPQLLYMEGTLLQNLNSLNPGISTLRGTAEYVLSLCGKYAIQAQNILNSIAGGLATITGPSNQSVLVGQSASFTIGVTSSSAYTIQWFRNGVLIPGATGLTYTLLNVKLTDSGALFSAVVTNGAGPSSSATGVLTVTATLQGSFYYTSTDPGPTLLASSDPFSYQETFSITNGNPWVMNVPVAATPNMFIVVKGPIGQPIKTAWNNQGVNNGPIPDPAWQNTLAFGGMQYYYTRQAISLDPTQTLTLS